MQKAAQMASAFRSSRSQAEDPGDQDNTAPAFVAALHKELQGFLHGTFREELEGLVRGVLREELASVRDTMVEAVREGREDADSMQLGPAITRMSQDKDVESEEFPTAWVMKRRVNPFLLKFRPTLKTSLSRWFTEGQSAQPDTIETKSGTYNHLIRDEPADDDAGEAVQRQRTRKPSLVRQLIRRSETEHEVVTMPSHRPHRNLFVPSPAVDRVPSRANSEAAGHVQNNASEASLTPRGSTVERLKPSPSVELEKSSEWQMALEEQRREKPPLLQVVDGVPFEYFSLAMVLLNVVSIGVQTEFMARNLGAPAPAFFGVLDHIFAVVFTFELAMRVAAHGRAFFCGDGRFLNIFDFVIIVAQIAEELSMLFHGLMGPWGGNTLRFLRLFRCIRIFRVTRVLASIGDLRTLLISVSLSMKSLFWVIVMLGALTFTFGVFLTQMVTARMVQYGDEVPEDTDELRRFYGSVGRSMLSLFQVISEGIHWGEVMEPLVLHCSPWLMVLFLFYITFTLFALLNVVTGLFVEAAINATEEDKKQALATWMCQLFLNFETNEPRGVTWDEFCGHLNTPQMKEYLKVIDLDPEDATQLFLLLDEEGSGVIDAEVLVSACLRLHGNAKALELAAMMQELRMFTKRFQLHADRVEKRLFGAKRGGASKTPTSVGAGAVTGLASAPGTVQASIDRIESWGPAPASP